MLDQVGDTVFVRFLVARAILDPDPNGGRMGLRHRLGQHPHAVGQQGFAVHASGFASAPASDSCWASRTERRILPLRSTSSTLTITSSPSLSTSSTRRT